MKTEPTRLDIIADEAHPYGFRLEAAGPSIFYLARYTATRRSITIGAGDTLIEECDPAMPLFYLGGMEADGNYMEGIEPIYPAPMPLAEALEKGRELARAIDSGPVPTMGAHTWRDQFPDYPTEAMPKLPPHWEDVSWHNDLCPHFICYRAQPDNEAESLCVWTAYPDPNDRPEMSVRFIVSRLDAVGADVATVYEGDDWSAVLDAIWRYALARPIQTRAQAESFIRALADAGRSYHFDDDPSDISDIRTGQPTFTMDEAEAVSDRMDEIYGLGCWTREDCPIGVALAYETAVECL